MTPRMNHRRYFQPIVLVAALLLSGLLLTACGTAPAETDQSATVQGEGAGAAQDVKVLSTSSNANGEGRFRPNPNRSPVPVTAVATRTVVNRATTSPEVAITGLTTWNSTTLGITPGFSEAKGATKQVLATYDLLTNNFGKLTANIDSSRTGYAGKITNGGYSVVLLGGGSTVSNQNLTFQIQSASLGYTQLPATSYPSSSSAALTQLKTAFPALAGYEFTAAQTPNNNSNAYIFYATSKTGVNAAGSRTGVQIGVVRIGDKVWTYATVGTGSYAPVAQS